MTKELKFFLGLTIVMLAITLVVAKPDGTTRIRIYDDTFDMKNLTYNNASIYISLRGAPFISGNTTRHYYMVLIDNQRNNPLNLNKPQKAAFLFDKDIVSAVGLYEVVNFTEITENYIEPGHNGMDSSFMLHYHDIEITPVSGISVPKKTAKWYVLALDAPAWSEAKFNVTFGSNLTLDPDIIACGTTISAAGIYTMTANRVCTGHGITVASSDVLIEFAGYYFDGDDGVGDYGVNINSGYENITIQNGKIWDFGVGIYGLTNLTNINISNMSINSSAGAIPAGRGIRLTGDTDLGYLLGVSIDQCTIFNNVNDGIFIGMSATGAPMIDSISINNSMLYSNGNTGQIWFAEGNGTIENVTVHDAGGSTTGIEVSSTGNKNILSNTAYNTTGTGIRLYNTSGTLLVDGNIVHDCTYGIGAQTGSNGVSTISDNTIYGGVGASEGIYVNTDTTEDTIVSGNVISNVSYGLRSDSATRTNFTVNTVYNVTRCVYFSTATNSLVYDNICTNMSGHGIFLNTTSTGNIIQDNSITNSTSANGCIYLSESSTNLITQNTITTCSGNGIQIISSSASNNVTSNTITTPGAAASCIESNSNSLLIDSNTCVGGYDGLTMNTGATNETVTNNNFTNFSRYGMNFGEVWGNIVVENNTIINTTDYGIRVHTGFDNASVNMTGNNIYNNTKWIQSSTTNTSIWINTTMGWNSSINVFFPAFNLTNENILETTSVYFQPTYYSIDSANVPELNVSATLHFYDADCSDDWAWRATGFQTTRSNIIVNGDPAAAVTCSGTIIEYNVTDFSGYTTWPDNTTYSVTYADPAGILNMSCWQPYMNNTEPNYQTTHTPIFNLTNPLGSTIYNITLGLNESLTTLNGTFNLFAWTTPYRPANQSQNWSNTGQGIVYIPRQITNDTSTIILRRIQASSSVGLWVWGDCLNISNDQSKTFNLTWGGG